LSTVGYAQRQKASYVEPPLVTAGKQLEKIAQFIAEGETAYSASDVLRVLLRSQDGADDVLAPANAGALTQGSR
ncbi:MAG TPA: hypothetical protein V6D17_02225, partial [Candidatus Obscuribacterales bacterium]